MMGNGVGLKITHIGTSYLCHSSCPRSFALKNLLCIPHIKKNWISVSQFTKDKNVIL